MMLDDVYGSDDDQDPPQQETEPWVEEDSSLEWEETEIRTLARELSGPGRTADWLFN